MGEQLKWNREPVIDGVLKLKLELEVLATINIYQTDSESEREVALASSLFAICGYIRGKRNCRTLRKRRVHLCLFFFFFFFFGAELLYPNFPRRPLGDLSSRSGIEHIEDSLPKHFSTPWNLT